MNPTGVGGNLANPNSRARTMARQRPKSYASKVMAEASKPRVPSFADYVNVYKQKRRTF